MNDDEITNGGMPNANPFARQQLGVDSALQHVLHPSQLRAYFAAHAPITMADAIDSLMLLGERDPAGGVILDALVGMRIEYADRMLAALAKGGAS